MTLFKLDKHSTEFAELYIVPNQNNLGFALPSALSNLFNNLCAIPRAPQAAASIALSLFPRANASCRWYILTASSTSPILIKTSPILPKARNFPVDQGQRKNTTTTIKKTVSPPAKLFVICAIEKKYFWHSSEVSSCPKARWAKPRLQ